MKGANAFSHKDADRRILRLVKACVSRIEKDPKMLDRARIQSGRYSNAQLRREWQKLLDLPLPKLRAILLEESDEGDRIRQSVPFGGFLSNEKRMRILKTS
jgi:hypothetical protein